MSDSPLLLGVDGGGTSTIAWLADLAGNVVGRGRGGPGNAKVVGESSARRALESAIEAAFTEAKRSPAPVAAACFGFAGCDRPEDRERLNSWAEQARLTDHLILVNDGDLLLAAGTPEGWGVGVVSGTGSIAVGRAPDGRSARASGWGPLFGDEGSAYWVAIAALRWVARISDGREENTKDDPLAQRICERFGVQAASDLIRVLYAPGTDRAQIARLAPDVAAAAQEHSKAANAILDAAAEELAMAVHCVASQLGFLDASGQASFPLVTAGGFLLATPAVNTGMLQRLRKRGVEPSLVSPVPDPVFGALTLARRALLA